MGYCLMDVGWTSDCSQGRRGAGTKTKWPCAGGLLSRVRSSAQGTPLFSLFTLRIAVVAVGGKPTNNVHPKVSGELPPAMAPLKGPGVIVGSLTAVGSFVLGGSPNAVVVSC